MFAVVAAFLLLISSSLIADNAEEWKGFGFWIGSAIDKLRAAAVSYRAFSYDVTAAILVFQNKETVAILVYQAVPPGIKNQKSSFGLVNLYAADHMSEIALYFGV